MSLVKYPEGTLGCQMRRLVEHPDDSHTYRLHCDVKVGALEARTVECMRDNIPHGSRCINEHTKPTVNRSSVMQWHGGGWRAEGGGWS